jgi:phenylalanyl-tRNA synthetase beta chain
MSSLEETALPKYRSISKFPAVRRDLAIVIDKGISVAELEKKVLKFARQLLIKLRIFDIYHGEGIEDGKKSVAMGLTFQDPSRTLVDSEINEIIDRVVLGLQQDLNAILRA